MVSGTAIKTSEKDRGFKKHEKSECHKDVN